MEIKNKIKNVLTEKVFSTIKNKKLIQEGEHIVIGLSGGPDSVCLFLVMNMLKEELGIKTITCVHVNHMLRGEMADRDEAYCKELCAKVGVNCEVIRFDCEKEAAEKKLTCEEAGRIKRYEAFSGIASKIAQKTNQNVKIAVAHNSCDQAETVLFRILRGTGVDGLAAMEYSRKDKSGIDIIRPLLDISRREIEEFCYKMEATPRIDQSNFSNVYTRNRIRLELLPYLEENFNPNIISALNRLAATALEDKDFISMEVDRCYEDVVVNESKNCVEFSVAKLMNFHKAIRKRFYRRALCYCGLENDIQYSHVMAIEKLIESGVTGKTIELPLGYTVSMSYGNAIISTEQNEIIMEERSVYQTVISLEEYESFVRKKRYDDKVYLAFDWEEFNKNNVKLVYRTRKDGDWIAIRKTDGTTGRKKIQDVFVDMKVSRDMRDKIYMLALGSEILFINGRISTFGGVSRKYTCKYRINDETKSIVLLEIPTD